MAVVYSIILIDLQFTQTINYLHGRWVLAAQCPFP